MFSYRTQQGFEVWILPMFGDRKPFPFIQGKGNECIRDLLARRAMGCLRVE